MSRKLSYEEVKEYIESEGYELLTLKEDYVNTHQKLDTICPKEHDYSVSYKEFKTLGNRCKTCFNERKREIHAFSYEYVKHYIEIESGSSYKLLSAEYINAQLPLKLECDKGHIFEMNLNNFRQGNQRCPFCSGNKKHKGEFVYDKFIEEGLIPQFKPKDYINSHQNLPYICSYHKENGVQYKSFTSLLSGHGKCIYCRNEIISKKNGGSNSSSWKGGITSLSIKLRDELKDWKKQCMRLCDYKCIFTGIKDRFKIHHLKSFNSILEEVVQENDITLKEKYSQYDLEEYKLIKDKMLEKHEFEIGVVLCEQLHLLFHKQYGFGNNTIEQFLDFVNHLEKGDFNYFLEENNLKLNINYGLLNKITERKVA